MVAQVDLGKKGVVRTSGSELAGYDLAVGENFGGNWIDVHLGALLAIIRRSVDLKDRMAVGPGADVSFGVYGKAA